MIGTVWSGQRVGGYVGARARVAELLQLFHAPLADTLLVVLKRERFLKTLSVLNVALLSCPNGIIADEPSSEKKENRQASSLSPEPRHGQFFISKKERKKTDNPREGWVGGRHAASPPPHRDFKERSVVLAVAHPP